MEESSRRIVICLDGTKNSPRRNDTNVCRIYRLAKDVRGNVAYYDPGIGTLPKPGRARLLLSHADRFVGMLSGHGMVVDVAEAYRFLCNTFRDGDRLFFFGFSRGAYATRLLASVVAQIGLLPPQHDQLIPYAVNIALANRPDEAAKFSRKLQLKQIEIEFLGLFDTVKTALFAIDAGWSPLRVRVPLAWYNDSVRHVAHAMAIDEKRALYPVNRWADAVTRPATVQKGRTVEQVWFPGDHCDVGGSHTENGLDLSVAPLAWMISQANAHGLVLDGLSAEQAHLASNPECLASLDSHSLGWEPWYLLAELLPTFSANLDDYPRWRFPNLRQGRFMPADQRFPARVHGSVKERLATGRGPDGKPYRPKFLTGLLGPDLANAECMVKWV